MPNRQITDVIDDIDDILEQSGVHGVLKFLNSRAPHRFTGIYRLSPLTLQNVRLYDRENPDLEVSAEAPLRETYCSITGSSAAPFATADALADERLTHHPARDSTLSYCGVPILSESGKALGTLCHFDVVPREIPSGEGELMLAAAEKLLPVLRAQGHFP